MIKDTVKNTKLIDSGRFYKINEEIGLRYYQLPKALFNNPKYKGLSLGAKAMYAILRDRQKLSISNNYKSQDKWVDENGNIYLLFAIEPKKGDNRKIEEKPMRDFSLTEILGVSKNTVTKYKKELIDYDLIFIKKMGQGKVDRIYVLKPELQPINVEKYKTTKNRDSKIPNNGNSKSQELTGNETDTNETEFIDTQSVNQADTDTKRKEYDQEKDARLTEYKKINYYFQDKLRFEDLKIAHSSNGKLVDEIELNIIEMYLSEYIVIKDKRKSQSVVRSALDKLTYWHIDSLISKYLEVSSTTRIKSPKAYIQAMLYNTAFENELAITNELKHIGAI